MAKEVTGVIVKMVTLSADSMSIGEKTRVRADRRIALPTPPHQDATGPAVKANEPVQASRRVLAPAPTV